MFKQEFEEMDQCTSCYSSECSCMEKENISQQDLSLYCNQSPSKNISRPRCPLGEYDSNSRDSGFHTANSDGELKFVEFAKSLGVTPRDDVSPRTKSSFCSMDSMDEEFFDFADIGKPLDINAELPADFNTLLNGTLIPQKKEIISPEFDLNVRPLLRRSVSLNVTPSTSKVRSCLFRNEDSENRSFKRPDPPMELGSPIQLNKRTKIQDAPFKAYQRSLSATEESIECALQRSSAEPDLIGDFSKNFCLPLVSGRHPDLKCVNSRTLAAVLRGEYDDIVDSCTVVDCRYPYEYKAGHICGAVNFYTKDGITSLIKTSGSPPPAAQQTKRNIMIFHCEYSSQRGPTMYRFLRNLDRTQNKDYYPALYYPELYVLEGGYRGFYTNYPELCDPSGYIPMLHPAHQDELCHFRAKSKSCNDRSIGGRGSSFKRSSFM